MHTSKHKIIILIVLAVLLAVALAVVILNDTKRDAGDAVSVQGLGDYLPVEVEDGIKKFRSRELGIAYEYPSDYLLFLMKKTDESGMTEHQARLMPDVPLIQDAIAGKEIPATEWPPSIGISSYKVTSAATLEDWIRSNPMQANYFPLNPTEDVLIPTTIAGIQALRYTTHGLYEYDTVVFAYDAWIVVASVGSFGPEDDIRSDFDTILTSVVVGRD